MMLKTHKTFKKLRDRRGATAVEFAFVAPVFFAVTFFCFEFARISMMRNLAQNAAYEASRFAMMEGATESDGEATAAGVLARLGTKGATIDTVYEPIYRSDGSVAQPKAYVKTTISIPIGQNTIVFPAAAFGSKSITAEAQLRSERYLGYFDSN